MQQNELTFWQEYTNILHQVKKKKIIYVRGFHCDAIYFFWKTTF